MADNVCRGKNQMYVEICLFDDPAAGSDYQTADVGNRKNAGGFYQRV